MLSLYYTFIHTTNTSPQIHVQTDRMSHPIIYGRAKAHLILYLNSNNLYETLTTFQVTHVISEIILISETELYH